MRASPYRALLALVAVVLAALTCSAAGSTAHTHLAAPAGVLTVFEAGAPDSCPDGPAPAPAPAAPVADHCAEESAPWLADLAPLLPVLVLLATVRPTVAGAPGPATAGGGPARPGHGRTLLNRLCVQRT
ncbi:hypothetical protein ACIRBX_18435 [Kitasatospora sp. NPDC096147]|uniref:hypothetical protein n=1 Tax=Kitasatospora sp. NPDC096147 TaxID=3364093 RepID=UPI00380170BA